jgi:transposase
MGGQAADITQAEALWPDEPVEAVVADKSYDADAFIATVRARGAVVVIPPRKHRKQPRAYDRHVYQERPLIECFFGKIKHSRRIFSRFEKTARHYMGFLRFVATLIWLR